MGLIDSLSDAALRDTPAAGGAIQRQREDTRPSLPSGFVRRVLDMRDSVPQLTRDALPGYIHVSALAAICPRQWLLMLDMGVRNEESVTGAHRVMWKIGRAVESHIRDQLVDGYRPGVFGVWKCACGGRAHTGFRPRTEDRCSLCQQPMSHYHEITLVDHEHGVTGNPDIILRHEEKFLPVEIKSIVRKSNNAPCWEDLTAPLPGHVMQALGYRRLLQLAGRQVHDDVVIVYCAKDFKWGSPYKEYHVNGSTRRNEETMDALFAAAKTIKDNHAAGTLTPRELCQNIRSPRAKNCPVAAACFERS